MLETVALTGEDSPEIGRMLLKRLEQDEIDNSLDSIFLLSVNIFIEGVRYSINKSNSYVKTNSISDNFLYNS